MWTTVVVFIRLLFVLFGALDSVSVLYEFLRCVFVRIGPQGVQLCTVARWL